MKLAALIASASVFILCTVGCTPKNITPPKTQLEVRQYQTRNYNSMDTKQVMKAVINALQDEGYIIKNADKELGFITAAKEIDVESSGEAFVSRLFLGAAARFKKNSILEASANISEYGKDTKVRMIFQAKTLDNFGSPLDAKQMDDENFYQTFFSKIDKSLFLEREV